LTHGYVNRVVPDDQLEQETDRIGRRLASFDKRATLAAAPPDPTPTPGAGGVPG
jgi:hypothetical protein